jgi:hypothetical protein
MESCSDDRIRQRAKDRPSRRKLAMKAFAFTTMRWAAGVFDTIRNGWRRRLGLPILLLFCFGLCGCAVDITNACAKYREAVGPEVVEYANADGVVTPEESAILKADADFQSEIQAGPTVENAETYRAKVGQPWLKWVDATRPRTRSRRSGDIGRMTILHAPWRP